MGERTEARSGDKMPDESGEDKEYGVTTCTRGEAERRTFPGVSDAEPPSPLQYPSSWRALIIVLALSMDTFLVAFDQTVMGIAIPKITQDFQTLADVGWYGSGYFLTSTAFQPTFGRIYRTFNPKWTFLTAILFFGLGSFACGAAPYSWVVIAGRAVAGVGVAGIFSGTLVIIDITVPLNRRPMATGVLGLVWGIAFVVGPILGGILTDHITWRWCFYINLPIGAVTGAVVLFLLSPPPKPQDEKKSPFMMRIRELDLVGALISLLAMICLLLGLRDGNNTGTEDWGNPRSFGLIIGSVVLSYTFVIWQIFLGDEATIPLRVMRQRSVASSCIFVLFFSGACYVEMYYLPLFFQTVKDSSATESGIQMMPILLATVISSAVSGALTTAFGYYTPILIASTAILAIGFGLMTTFSVDIPTGKWMGYQILAGTGVGAGLQIPMAAVQTVLPHDDVVIGSACVVFFQNLGGTVFISVAQSLFQSGLEAGLRDLAPAVPPQVVEKAGATGVRSRLADLGISELLPEILKAYVQGLRDALRVSMALVLAAFAAICFLEWRSVRRLTDERGKDRPCT